MNKNDIQKDYSKKHIYQHSELHYPYVFKLEQLLFLIVVLTNVPIMNQFNLL